MRVYTVRMPEGKPGRLEGRKELSLFTRVAGVIGFLFLLMFSLAVGFQLGKFYFGG